MLAERPPLPKESGPHPHAPPAAVPPWYDYWKAVADFLAAVLLLTLTAPVTLLAVLLVKLTSPGPAFYAQTRLGRYGRPFRIFKIRSMTHDCEKHSGARWCVPGDPRVTPIGRILRKLHVDEVPQLWNVLRGEMSLLGPRPERPEFVPQLEQCLPLYRDRLRVRPGLSGLAQVQLPPDTDLDSVRRKLACDLYYVGHLGPLLDARLALATLGYLLRVPVGVYLRLLGVPTLAEAEPAYQRLLAKPRCDAVPPPVAPLVRRGRETASPLPTTDH